MARRFAKVSQIVEVELYYKISLYSTFFNLHCSQLAIASRGEQWLDIYTRQKSRESYGSQLCFTNEQIYK